MPHLQLTTARITKDASLEYHLTHMN